MKKEHEKKDRKGHKPEKGGKKEHKHKKHDCPCGMK
jgi:hypothetical protein